MCLAVPGKIIEITGADIEKSAKIDFGGITKWVSLAVLPDAAVGDYVIVHAGVAISRIDEAEAKRAFEYFERISTEVNESGENEVSD